MRHLHKLEKSAAEMPILPTQPRADPGTPAPDTKRGSWGPNDVPFLTLGPGSLGVGFVDI